MRLQQAQVHPVLAPAVVRRGGPTARRHDVGCRVESFALGRSRGQHAVVVLEAVTGPGNLPEDVCQQLPGGDPVEELKEQRAEEDFRGRGVSPVNDSANQVLADSVGSAVGVGKLVCAQGDILRPRSRPTLQPAKEDGLTLGGKAPEALVNGRHLGAGKAHKNMWEISDRSRNGGRRRA